MQTRTLPRSGRACLQGGLGFARDAKILCDSNVKPGTTNFIAVVIQYSVSDHCGKGDFWGVHVRKTFLKNELCIRRKFS